MGDDEQHDPALSPVDGPATSTGRVASWAVRWLGASWGWSTRAGRFIGVYGTTAG